MRSYLLLQLEVDEAPLYYEILATVAFLQLVVVDADHLQLQLALRRMLVQAKLHIR